METMEMSIQYAGATVEVIITPEEVCAGAIYAVDMEGAYSFTILENEEGEWNIMREQNGIAPIIDKELYDAVIKKMRYQLRYAA